MLKSIIERHSRLAPMTKTEIEIVKSAVKLFLKHGFSGTTIRMVSEDTGIKPGNITYYYRTKEDMLLVLVQEIMDYHLEIIDNAQEVHGDSLLAYATEITVQIALCENNKEARDLYYSAYRHPATFDYIKDWAAKKNYHLLKSKLPDWTEDDFRRVENVTSGIELAAFTAPKNRYFTLNDKISLFLDSMMKLYDIPENDRKETIDKVTSLDCENIAKEMFDKFIARLDGDKQNE